MTAGARRAAGLRPWLWLALAALWDPMRALSGASAAAQAADFEERLSVQPGATCLESERLEARIVRWREGAGIEPGVRVSVRGDSQLSTRVYFSVSRVGDAPTERTLENAPSDCDQLHSAVALSIALAIDALFSSEQVPPLPAADEPPRIEHAANATQTGSPYSLQLGLLVGASVGVVPNMAPAALPRVQLSVTPWLGFALAGVGTYASDVSFTSGSGVVDTSVIGGGGDACLGGETVERMSFVMCTGLRGGMFVARGDRLGAGLLKVTSTRPWWAVAVSGQARAWIVPNVGIGLGIEALFALASRDLVVTYTEQRLSVPRVGLAISVGPVFRFF